MTEPRPDRVPACEMRADRRRYLLQENGIELSYRDCRAEIADHVHNVMTELAHAAAIIAIGANDLHTLHRADQGSHFGPPTEYENLSAQMQRMISTLRKGLARAEDEC